MGRKDCRRKQRHLKEPLRFTSDGNADRRTAWLRLFRDLHRCCDSGLQGAPVSDFGIKNRVAEMKKARNKGISGNKIRRYRLV